MPHLDGGTRAFVVIRPVPSDILDLEGGDPGRGGREDLRISVKDQTQRCSQGNIGAARSHLDGSLSSKGHRLRGAGAIFDYITKGTGTPVIPFSCTGIHGQVVFVIPIVRLP